jgi:hypothetical protein
VSPARTLAATFLAAGVAGALIAALVTSRDPQGEPGRAAATAPRFSPEDAIELRLTRAEGSAVLRKRERWELTAPRALAADAEEVRAVLAHLAGVTPVRVVGRAPDLGPYGLAPPMIRYEVRLRDGRAVRFHLGAADSFGGGAFARQPPAKEVVVISADAARALDRDFLRLRDRQLVRGPVREARRVRIERRKQAVVLERTRRRNWSLNGVAPADTAAMESLLGTLERLRARRYLREGLVDRSAFRLDRPDVRVTLDFPSGSAELGLARQPNGKVAALALGQDAVAEVGEDVLEILLRPRSAWRSARALRFEREAVASIRILRSSGVIALSRDRRRRWEMLLPTPSPGSEEAITRLLAGLEAMVVREPNDAPREIAPYGLAPPRLEIALEDARGALLDALHVGRADGRFFYAKSARWRSVFRIEAAAMAGLPTTAERLR